MRHLINAATLIMALFFCTGLWGVDIIASNDEAETGKTFEYPITLKEATNLGGIGFTLRFDPEILGFDELNTGSLASNALMQHNPIEPGKVLVSIVDANGMNGNGDLLLFKFRTKGEVGNNAIIALEDVRAYDTDLLDVPFNLSNGSIEVVAASGIALPGIKIEYIVIGALVLLVAFMFGKMSRTRKLAH